MAIDIVSFPMKKGGSFHCYVSLPEGTTTIHWVENGGNQDVFSSLLFIGWEPVDIHSHYLPKVPQNAAVQPEDSAPASCACQNQVHGQLLRWQCEKNRILRHAAISPLPGWAHFGPCDLHHAIQCKSLRRHRVELGHNLPRHPDTSSRWQTSSSPGGLAPPPSLPMVFKYSRLRMHHLHVFGSGWVRVWDWDGAIIYPAWASE